jgi:hypothetical protein
MIEPAVLAAIGVVAGAILSVSARDGRVVAIGLLVAMVAAPLVASPLPDSLSVAARIIGAVLAAYLIWASARGPHSGSVGSAVGLAAETSLAAAAFAIGLSVSMVDPLPGPAVAQAAGLALIVLSVVPLVGRDTLRLGVGVTLLVLGCSLFTAAWLGATPPLAHLSVAALLVGIAGASSLTIARQPTLAAESSARASAVVPVGKWEAAGTVRSRPSRPRERTKSPAEEISVWVQTEQGKLDIVPVEAPPDGTSTVPAAAAERPARLSRLSRSPKP